MSTHEGRLDTRYSMDDAVAPPFEEVERLLAEAELYWLTTVRADGRPHVTPLVGVYLPLASETGGGFRFATGDGEQKQRNLAVNDQVVVTTGINRWAEGTDVVLEGPASRTTGKADLEPWAAAFREKYGDAWAWEATEDGFEMEGSSPEVYVVRPTKIIVFGKDPHHQTTFRF